MKEYGGLIIIITIAVGSIAYALLKPFWTITFLQTRYGGFYILNGMFSQSLVFLKPTYKKPVAKTAE